MTDKKSSQLNPTTPATCAGTKYAHSSIGSAEPPQGFKKAPTIITPGGKSPRATLVEVVENSHASTSEQQVEFEYRNLIAIFGGLSTKISTLGPEPLFRIAQSLSYQQQNEIDPRNVVFGQRLLAVPEDELALHNAIMMTFKGGIMPIIENISMASETTTGTLYWRSTKSPNGYLVQSLEVADRDTQRCLFARVTPLSTVWPPPIILSAEVSDNTVWDFRLREGEMGHNALLAIAQQLDKRYCGAFFTKVCTNI
jgi:hypothetical protein